MAQVMLPSSKDLGYHGHEIKRKARAILSQPYSLLAIDIARMPPKVAPAFDDADWHDSDEDSLPEYYEFG